ncbi:MAG TPA: DUF4271 domain-containing protein [Chitinophagaceae bacterium]|nr:DUF4271 domain-containing protein [Chitinophagaceae bacterium]
MKKIFCGIIVLFYLTANGYTQSDTGSVNRIATDTAVVKDTVTVINKDTAIVVPDTLSVSRKPADSSMLFLAGKTGMRSEELSWPIMQHHPYFDFTATPEFREVSGKKKFTGKEWLFYTIVFLIIVFSLLRLAFPKYFNDLFRLFFRRTLNQVQIREQLVQTPLPSLLLNIFFFVTGGFYITLILKSYDLDFTGNFWLLMFYCILGLSVTYSVKFLGLKLTGWVFGMQEAAESYSFIVFIANKMMGIVLLPFLVLLAFSKEGIYTASFTLSLIIIGAILFYRFIMTYGVVRNQVKVNPFHFFIYLLAFEIIPLLLIYKLLLVFFTISA